VLAIAATFLIALVLGTRLRPSATVDPSASDRPGLGTLASDDHSPLSPHATTPSPSELERPSPVVVPGRWPNVTIVAENGPRGKPELISLPPVERDRFDETWLKNLPPALPPEVLQAFRRTGRDVRLQRELVPVEMQDGRKLVVPVDRVEVFVSGGPEL
jgi:hypothetical protein